MEPAGEGEMCVARLAAFRGNPPKRERGGDSACPLGEEDVLAVGCPQLKLHTVCGCGTPYFARRAAGGLDFERRLASLDTGSPHERDGAPVRGNAEPPDA